VLRITRAERGNVNKKEGTMDINSNTIPNCKQSNDPTQERDLVTESPPRLPSSLATLSVPQLRTTSGTASDTQPSDSRPAGEQSALRDARNYEYWEEKTAPKMHCTSERFRARLESAANDETIESALRSAHSDPEQVLQGQFRKIKRLIEFAYHAIPLYRTKYSEVGFEPGDLKRWEDYHRLPVVTKQEMIAHFPHRNTDLSVTGDALFTTRSSGSSGQTLRIHVDDAAIIEDCIQSVQQFGLQSAGRYQKSDTIAHVYTVPWWVDSLNAKGDYPTVFISSLIKPSVIGEILSKVKPDILSLYPSNLETILPHLTPEVRRGLKLIVTHSEMSSPERRKEIGNVLGVPVLDEYSSEELTRIAIELPDRIYRVCADAVVLSVLSGDGSTSDSGFGPAVGTNLLNRAMPFIKYVQGDLIEIAPPVVGSDIGWPVLKRIEGRQNDTFIARDGSRIAAGTLLDISYRWQYEHGLAMREFELIQTGPTKVTLRVFDPLVQAEPAVLEGSLGSLRSMLRHVMGEIELSVDVSPNSFKDGNRKVRPIRRTWCE
jgi:phenylacetate-CoA ligase